MHVVQLTGAFNSNFSGYHETLVYPFAFLTMPPRRKKETLPPAIEDLKSALGNNVTAEGIGDKSLTPGLRNNAMTALVTHLKRQEPELYKKYIALEGGYVAKWGWLLLRSFR